MILSLNSGLDSAIYLHLSMGPALLPLNTIQATFSVVSIQFRFHTTVCSRVISPSVIFEESD